MDALSPPLAPPHPRNRYRPAVFGLPLMDGRFLQAQAALVADFEFEALGELVFELLGASEQRVALDDAEVAFDALPDSAMLVNHQVVRVLFGLERVAVGFEHLLYRFGGLDDREPVVLLRQPHHELSDGEVFDAGVDEHARYSVAGQSLVEQVMEDGRILAARERQVEILLPVFPDGGADDPDPVNQQ